MDHLKDILDRNGDPVADNDEFYLGNNNAVLPYNNKKVSKESLFKECQSKITIKSKNPGSSKTNLTASKRKSFNRSVKVLHAAGCIASNDSDYLTIPNNAANNNED